jgi:hypothetical protein
VALRSKTANPQYKYYRWYWLVPQPPKPDCPRLNTHNGATATHRSKCPARTAAPVAGAGQCTGCIWATAGPLHTTVGSQEEPTRPSICASQLLQACCWALGVVVVEQGGQGVGKGVGLLLGGLLGGLFGREGGGCRGEGGGCCLWCCCLWCCCLCCCLVGSLVGKGAGAEGKGVGAACAAAAACGAAACGAACGLGLAYS